MNCCGLISRNRIASRFTSRYLSFAQMFHLVTNALAELFKITSRPLCSSNQRNVSVVQRNVL